MEKKKFNYVNDREIRAYDIRVDYTKRNIGKHFLDYLDPSNFNEMPMH